MDAAPLQQLRATVIPRAHSTVEEGADKHSRVGCLTLGFKQVVATHKKPGIQTHKQPPNSFSRTTRPAFELSVVP